MAANSKIQWCDHTFQCVKCSPQGNRIVKSESGWKEPLKWDREAKVAGERHRVFCASLADVFEDWSGPMSVSDKRILVRPYLDSDNIPANWLLEFEDTYKKDSQGWKQVTMQDVRNRLFRLIDATPNLDWLLLSKRPENFQRMWPSADMFDGETGDDKPVYLPNLWLGVSVENQQAADERIPILLRTPAAIRFLSCEPLLGPVVFDNGWSVRGKPWREEGNDIDLVIVGGESGPKARPCKVEWIRSIVQQCKEAGVSCFVKQMGGNIITRNDMIEDVFNNGESGWPDPQVEHNINGFREDHQGADCRIRLNDKKGGDMTEWPNDMRVRQMPKGAIA